MPEGKLSALQQRILQVLAGLEPQWTLTGGGALAGVYLGHRVTRDLDLFWHGHAQLGDVPRAVSDRLSTAGLSVEELQTAPAFHRLRVSDNVETCVLDLVADMTPVVETPSTAAIGNSEIRVDTRHEILVNKLCALLSRSELRDLRDLAALEKAGADLDRALADAPRKDGGFSALTLAWVLRQLDVERLGPAEGWTAAEVDHMMSFRDRLVEHLVANSAPAQ